MNKRITEKLKEKCGSSMILVLVFLLFCTFVGGSVLAVASANSARAGRLAAEEQQFLNQRNAATLMKDAFSDNYRPVAGETSVAPPPIGMSFDIITRTSQPVKITAGGGEVKDGEMKKTITFVFEALESSYPKPALQRLVYESAILRVLDMYNYSFGSGDSLELKNMEFLPMPGSGEDALVSLNSLENFCLESADNNSLSITLTDDATNDVIDGSGSAYVLCSAGDDPYHFFITFGDEGQDAQTCLKMNAMVSERPPYVSGTVYESRSDTDTSLQNKISTTTTTMTITWQSAQIVKGGAD